MNTFPAKLTMAICLMLLTEVAVAQNTADTNPLKPTAENVSDWRAYLLPENEDLVWQNVDWETTFGEGVVTANAVDKPLLLWVMNGHPFGCT